MQKFSIALESINSTTKRKEKSTILYNYLSSLSTDDLIPICRILLNEYTTNVGQSTINSIDDTQSTLFPRTITPLEMWQLIEQLTHSSNTNLLLINEIISNATPLEKKYIKKILLNNINIGISDNTILDVLGNILNIDNLRTKYAICSDITTHITHTYTGPKIFTPIKPMLAKVQEIEEPYQIQQKVDGFRFNFHKLNDIWAIYSRRCEDISSKHMDIGEMLTTQLSTVNSIILDGELATESMNCQESRRNDAKLIPKIFDILYYNGTSLIDLPLVQRLQYLKDLNLPTSWYVTSYYGLSIEDAFNHAIDNGFEGLVIKNINEPYIPHQRKWGKIKKGIDTIDLVITGYELGNGKRENTIGSLICSIMHDNTLYEFCRVGSGLTDSEITKLHNLLQPTITSTYSNIVTCNPTYVCELEYFEISTSPTYQLGYSLRFPVYLKLRNDKSISDCTNFTDLNITK